MEPEPMLIFTDDGGGMNSDALHRMLSFGYCDKVAVGAHKPIGYYGNGFKSGSMRLGKDALVFTKHAKSWSIGFLSQTFLAAIKANSVKVPMVYFDLDGKLQGTKQNPNLEAILKYSPFHNLQQLLEQFEQILHTGTRIVVFNLRREQETNLLELDFQTDEEDIRLRDHAAAAAPSHVDAPAPANGSSRPRRERLAPTDNPFDYSLRAYCSVLYLKPRMRIYIQDVKVQTKLIAHSLSSTKTDVYRPSGVGAGEVAKITFGLSTNKNLYGMMLYHRNRLIKAYLRVGMQMQSTPQGVGVIGVLEADWLQPTHNKQDFDQTAAYRNAIVALADRLNTYCWEQKEQKKKLQAVNKNPQPIAIDEEEVEISADETWVQCDLCNKWRLLPKGMLTPGRDEQWTCSLNQDPQYNSCDVPQQPFDTEDPEPKELRKVKQEKSRIERELAEKKQKEETRRQVEMQLKRQTEEKKRKEAEERERAAVQRTRELEQQKRALEEERAHEEERRRARQAEEQARAQAEAKRLASRAVAKAQARAKAEEEARLKAAQLAVAERRLRDYEDKREAQPSEAQRQQQQPPSLTQAPQPQPQPQSEGGEKRLLMKAEPVEEEEPNKKRRTEAPTRAASTPAHVAAPPSAPSAVLAAMILHGRQATGSAPGLPAESGWEKVERVLRALLPGLPQGPLSTEAWWRAVDVQPMLEAARLIAEERAQLQALRIFIRDMLERLNPNSRLPQQGPTIDEFFFAWAHQTLGAVGALPPG